MWCTDHTGHLPLDWKGAPADDRSSRIARRKHSVVSPAAQAERHRNDGRHLHGGGHRRAHHGDGRQRADRRRAGKWFARAGRATSSRRSCWACSRSATRRWPSTSPPPARSTATSRTGWAASWASASGVIITMAYIVFEGSLIGIFSLLLPGFRRDAVRHRRALAGPRDPDADAELHPDVLRREPRRQGARRVPGHRDLHAVARRAVGAVPGRRPGRLRGGRDAQPGRRVHSRRPASPARAPESGSSSRSGRGSASSRRRCTARSPRTPSGSSRAPP